jgi:ABC-type amino acid transport substrate-binding protein
MFFYIRQNRKKAPLIIISLLFYCAVFFLLFYSAGCGASRNLIEAPDAGSDESKLIVGCDPSYPVFEFLEDGNIVGFDVDIAREIASRMGRELKIVTIDWKETYGMPPDLELDMVISAVPIISEGNNKIALSVPYFTMEYMSVVLNETDIKTIEKLKGEAVGILGIEKKYLDEDYLLDYNIVEYNDVVVMVDDLKNKSIDGILISLPMGVNLLTGNTSIYKVLEVVKSNEEFGIVLKQDSALIEEVNKILEEIKSDWTYDEIYDRWFDYSS